MKKYLPVIFWATAFITYATIKIWPYLDKKQSYDNQSPRTYHQAAPGAPAPTEPVFLPAKNAPLFEPYSAHFEELFPARVLTMAARPLSDQYRKSDGLAPKYGVSGTIGVTLRKVKKGQRYVVEISADRFIAPSKETYEIVENAEAVILCPRINYDYKELRRNTQTGFINITFAVRQEGEQAGNSATRRWQVHQINDCPIQMESRSITHEGEVTSRISKQSYVIAGFVNENHPWIDTLLLDAKNTGICSEFVGYQGGNKLIGPQISAIWKALQNRGLSYSSVTTSTSSDHHKLQHVRFLEQSIATTQANCLDGSVLLCSILRKIGFNVGVMLVPGHAYVCVLDQANERWIFAIETTMLGKADLSEAARVATESGMYPLNKWSEETREHYDLVNISKLRNSGLNPIPFDEVAAGAFLPAQNLSTQIQSPTEIARQKRIALASRLNQKLAELRSYNGSRNDEPFRVSAFNLFTEIRQCQSAFNNLRIRPELESSGIPIADIRMANQYASIVHLLRTKSIDINTEVTESDLDIAKEITEALVDLANLPLNF